MERDFHRRRILTAVDSGEPRSASPGVGEVQPPAWSRRTALTAVFFIGFVAVQLIVPLVQVGSAPTRFGWKMFAATYPFVQFSAEYPDGTVERIRPQPYRKFRPEVRYENHMPAHLCGQLPDATAILVHMPNKTELWRRACR